MSFEASEIRELKKGRTPEQKKCVSYICYETGCFGAKVKDEEYDQLVAQKIQSTDWRRKALNKIGVDESQVNEVEPIHLESFYYDEKTIARQGVDKKWRSSHYQISWVFASDTHIYIWQYTFSMIDDTKKERTEEYFYKDITNFSTANETVEKDICDINCRGKQKWTHKNVDYNEFAVIVPGDKFRCSVEDNEYVESSVQGLKAKLREKKS